MNQDQTAVFMEHIRKHAIAYFNDFEPTQVEVQLKQRQERPSSILYRFTVCDEAQDRGVLVKVPYRREQPVSESDDGRISKPSLYPRVEAKDSHRLGYSALKVISDYFTNLGEEQLGTIRVLDYLPEHHAIITEASRDPSLRHLFMSTSRYRFGRPAIELEAPFRNVGRWLRLYHEMPKEDNVQVRHAQRSDYIASITTLTDFLASVLKNEAFFKDIAATLETSASKILPDALPLGLGHGDFAMRNILVGPNARITVIDTFAKWRTPIYEDIGYFLSALKLSATQVISQGLAFDTTRLSALEGAFLEGYFEEQPVPYPAIRLYEMLSLLDKWCSVFVHYHRGGEKFKNFRSVKVVLANRYIKRSATLLLKEISEFA